MACEKRHQIAAVHQAPGKLLGDAFFRPGLLLSGEGIVGDEPQRALLAAHERAAALGALAEGQHVEGRRCAAQLLHAHDLDPERGAEPGDERVRVQAELRLEDFDEPPPSRGRRGASLLDFERADLLRVGETHFRLPASSKIGMYMRTTIAPITRPIAVIRRGSKSRANQSTQREISSS